MSAPTRPCAVTRPVCGYMTRVKSLSSVDFPEPLDPISPTDSPGLAVTLTSRSTQRYRSVVPSRRARRRRSSSSRSSMRLRSARNCFQRFSATSVPSGNIGDPCLETLEDGVGGGQRKKGGGGGDAELVPLGRLAVENRPAIAVDDGGHGVDGDVQIPPLHR